MSWAARMHKERERGQATVEYVGMFVAISALVVALIAAFPTVLVNPVVDQLKNGICEVGSFGGCGTGGNPFNPAPPAASPTSTPTPTPAPSADVPNGLDPASALVQAMQTTERGRQALQWLADNNVPIVVSPTARGAYWDRTKIVLGPSHTDPAVLIHEANHARYSRENRNPNADTTDKQAFVDAWIAQEVDSSMQQIQAAQEFRAAGRNVATQPGEPEYNAAYQQAIAAGASDAVARQAASDAVKNQYTSGVFKTSNTNETYPDYYGNYWDARHPTGP